MEMHVVLLYFQFHAMDTLHKHKYDISKAIASLVPPGGPVLCRDEMEEWSASEANLFEEALDKYGKDFNDIRQDFVRLPINQLPLPFKTKSCMLLPIPLTSGFFRHYS